MNDSGRRQFISLGITAAGSALLVAPGLARGSQNAAVNDPLGQDQGLRFQLPPNYRPDLSAKAQQRLTRATLDFMLAAHPPGVTLALWESNPRDLPQLEEHIATTVAAVCRGIEKHLAAQPVDPVLAMALLYNESRFSPVVISPAGALGMAQFMPNTALEYELSPIAHPELWQRYRDVKARAREERGRVRQQFVRQFSLPEFSTQAVIQHTLDTGKLEALEAFQELANPDKPEQEALNEYIAAVKDELARYDFFADGEKPISSLDARASYQAPAAAVDYLARRLAENSGMMSSAVAAYNAGPAAVRDGNPRSVLYGYGDLPAYPETVRYVQRIMVVYSKIRAELG